MSIVPLSLSNRFRGALLGAALGEVLGANYQHRRNLQIPSSWLEIGQWGFDDWSDVSRLAWGQLAIEQVKALKQLGYFPPFSEERLTGASASGWAGLTIATLPMTLFYHDNWQQLHTLVQSQLASHSYPSGLSAAVSAVGYILSLALREQLHLPDLIPQLITDLDLYNTLPPLAQQLDHVPIWHSEKVSSSVAQLLVTQSASEATVFAPVTIAIYSLLQTPHSFQASLLQAARFNFQPQVACAITGALLGAYNGVAALPLLWRRRLQTVANRSSPLLLFWQVASTAELLQYADLLLAGWSGVYALHTSTQPVQIPVTASPGIIRPR